MKKRKKSTTACPHDGNKQLTIPSFFTLKTPSTPNSNKCNSNFFMKNSVESSSKDREVPSIISDASPEPNVIEAAPHSKPKSVIRLSLDLQNEKRTPKKNLFLDTSVISSKCENIQNSPLRNVPLPQKRVHDDDTVLELLEELENSPPTKKSTSRRVETYSKHVKSPTKKQNCEWHQFSKMSTTINSFVSISNRTNLKLSSSRTKTQQLSECNRDINLSSNKILISSVVSGENPLNEKIVLKATETNRMSTQTHPKTVITNSQKTCDGFSIIENLDKLFDNDVTDKVTDNSHSACESFVDIENLGDFFDSVDSYGNKELDLSEWKYCKIISIENQNYGIIVTLEEVNRKNTSSSTRCLIRGYWSERGFRIGDVISVKATFDSSMRYWLINEKHGFVVKYPDILVTGTNVVGSLFCLRSAILSYLFPGVESLNVSMLIGSLVHELLQEILCKKLYSEADMKSIATNLVKRQRVIFQAYECGASLSQLQMELDKFIPRITSFVEMYIKNKKNYGKMWAGQIREILSVEENFWMPQLGIKGKTDLVVKAFEDNKMKTIPIELKTGRASNTAEHRGQVVLYMLMMSELGISVDSGLLLYLREDVIHEVKPHHSEFNGLITMRNNMVDYFIENKRMNEQDGIFAVPVLPEPINHRSGCSRCPYLTVCSVALTEEPNIVLSDGNPLKKLSHSARSHLTSIHIRYVFQWLGLLKLEELERNLSKSNLSDIWHLCSQKRQDRGSCINQLKLIKVQMHQNKYLHYMKRTDDYNFDLSTLQAGDYVIVSEGNRCAITTGYVDHIEEDLICLKLDRRLPEIGKSGYIVDKYSVSESLTGFNTSSLLLLLEDSPSSDRLRRFIIDLELPRFSSIDDFTSKCAQETLSKLNSFQKMAVFKTLNAEDYCLIKGMPGTGKTATIVAFVKFLAQLGRSVLITSHTHSAVDNILLQLKDIHFLRLGSLSRVHPQLKVHCEEFILQNRNFDTIEDVENFYNEYHIIGVTCMGCAHILFSKKKFDYCIVDEATQVLQPSVIRAIKAAHKFVLVGDPEQLPPVVQSIEASRLGLSESLFKRLDKPEAVSVLSLQYRMNSEIMTLANRFAYNDLLQCDDENINKATIQVEYPSEIIDNQNWLELPLSENLSHSVIFMNTNNQKAQDSGSYCNKNEAYLTFTVVEMIIQYGVKEYSIGVIAPYREQVQLLKNIAETRKYDVEVNTIDQYQGRDKDVIIFSCTKSSYKKNEGILSDKRRIVVAITRAKKKLIIIGNLEVLRQCSTFEHLLQFIPKKNIIDVI